MALVLSKFLFLFFFLVFISACDQQKSAEQAKQECYKEGYTQGKVDGDAEGYKRGYDEGFKQTYPGSEHQLPGFLGSLQKIFSVFGALVIPVTLIILVLYLIRVSRSDEQISGKVLMGVLGAISAILLMNAFGNVSST
jgi:hypothetical protein